MPQILDQYGNPFRREVLTQDIAAATVTGVRSPFPGFVTDLTPDLLAAVLRAADSGDPIRYLELAETIEERDLHYAGVLGTRKRSVSQLEITVEAGGEDATSEGHAELVRAWLKRDTLADEIFDVLDAVAKGRSYTEIIWEVSEGDYLPGRLEWRDPRWFELDRHDLTTPLLKVEGGRMPLPQAKFIVASIKAKSGLPMRSGIARQALWAYMFKSFANKDWAIFTQNFGQPVRIGRYDDGATEAQKAILYEAVASIAGDCAAMIPRGMDIEFVESKSISASADLYLARCSWLDQQVSKAVLGQTATTDAIAGGHAVGQEHREVQEDIERADAVALAAILNRDVVRWIVDLNFGPQRAYPHLKIGRKEDTDVELLVNSVQKLVPLGLRVDANEMRTILGLKTPEPDADLLAPAATSAPPVTPAPALSPAPQSALPSAAPHDAIDGGIEAILEAGWEPAMAEIIAGLDEDLASVKTEAQLARVLADKMAAMNVSVLGEKLARAAFAAKLMGSGNMPLDD